jgi:hypothetical protein
MRYPHLHRGTSEAGIGWKIAGFIGLAAVLGPWAARAGRAQEFVITRLSGTAEAEVNFEEGVFVGMDSSSIVPPGVSAYAQVGDPSSGFGGGGGSAYQDVFGINAVEVDTQRALEDADDIFVRAETVYEISLETPTEMTGTVVFKFVINGGELRIRDFSRYNPFFQGFGGANVLADVDIFGEGRWSFPARLTKDPDGNPIVYHDDGLGLIDEFGVGFPQVTVSMDGDDAVATVSHFEGEVLLDLDDFYFIPQSFSYTMSAVVDLFDSFFTGGSAAIGDPLALSQGGSGDDIGAEFFLDGRPLSDFPIVIPEPAGCALMVVSGVAVLGRRLKARGRRGGARGDGFESFRDRTREV